jgi:hypothetical protein
MGAEVRPGQRHGAHRDDKGADERDAPQCPAPASVDTSRAVAL